MSEILSPETRLQLAAIRIGPVLGWASIGAVLIGLALDLNVHNRWLLVGSVLAAIAGNATAMLVPWREWLPLRRGHLLLGAWCGGLIAFVAALVATAGSSFSLLLFLVVPFITVVQTGRRRVFWLAASATTCLVLAMLVPLSAGATVVRLILLAVAVAVTLAVMRAIHFERVLARESNHRIKNDLQTAADLLLLTRPEGAGGEAFDQTAARIRAIATVHSLLTESEAAIDAEALLQSIAARAPAPVEIDAQSIPLDAATAQTLGIVANELVTNAYRHGAPPIRVRLRADRQTHLRVEDSGARVDGRVGFGLSLVRRLVEQGLAGRFELRGAATGSGTYADVFFPTSSR